MSTAFDPLSVLDDDPLDAYQQRLQSMLAQQPPAQTPGAPQQPYPQPPSLPPDEYESLLDQTLSSGGSALHWIGESLDKGFGGRTIRGLLGGEGIGALAHLIPFSDTLGLTDSGLLGNDLLANKNDVPDGRQLLENAGIVDHRPPGAGFDMSDVGGILTQAALDPAMYLTPFGLSKAGTLAEKLGVLPEFGTGLNKLTGALESAGPKAAGMTTTLGDVLKASPDIQLPAVQLAKARGLDIDSLWDQPLRGGFGVGLPVPGTSNITTIGGGPLSQMAGNAIDRISAGLRFSAPGRFAARLFEPESRQAGTAAGQIAGAQGFADAATAGADATEKIANAYQDLAAQGIKPNADAGIHNPDWNPNDALRGVLERTYPGGNVAADSRDLGESIKYWYPGANPDQVAALAKNVPLMRQALDEANTTGKALGFGDGLGDKTALYTPRVGEFEGLAPERGATLTGGQEAFETSSPSLRQRNPALTNFPPTAELPGGTASVERAMSDPRLVSEKANIGGVPTTPEQAKQILLSEYLGQAPEDAGKLAALQQELATGTAAKVQAAGGVGSFTPEEVLGPEKAATLDALQNADAEAEVKAKFFRNLPESYADGTQRLFPNDPLTDMYTRLPRAMQSQAYANQIHDLAARAGKEGIEGVPISKMLADNGMKHPEAILSVAERMAKMGKLDQATLDTLRAGKSAPLDEAAIRGTLPAGMDANQVVQMAQDSAKAQDAAYNGAFARVGKFAVPNDIAGDASRVMDFATGRSPESLNVASKLWNSATALFKSINTAPWPANKVRDLSTGLWQMLATGSYDRSGVGGWLNPANWIKPLKDAHALIEGKAIADAHLLPGLEHLSPEEANQVLRSRFLASRLNDPSALETSELAPGVATQPVRDMGTALPGAEPLNPGFLGVNFLKRAIPRSLEEANPLNVRGVGIGDDVATKDLFAPVKAGREASDYAWSLPKYAMAMAQMRSGVPWQEAAAIAKSAMGDFSMLTPFERNVMQKYAVPFYAWTRRMLPWTMREITGNPGGITAEAVRLAGSAGKSRGFVPKQVEGDLAVPISDEDAQGNKKYLAGTDLPFEVLNDLFHPGRTSQETVGNTLSGWAGMLNPLAKVPLELATNRQLYSGRDLSDLKGRLGLIGQQVSGSARPWPVPPLLEETIANSPLARVVTTAGKLLDERKSLGEKALNVATGVKTTDVDMNRARDVAGRDAAQTILQGSPGSPVRNFTDLYVRNQDLPLLSPDELRLYQLYRQIEAERKARQKAEQAQPVAQR